MGIFDTVLISKTVVLSDVSDYININTLFGAVAILAVLLLIALIYLANIMSYLKKGNTTNNASTGSNNSLASGFTAGEAISLADNNELVAVITAAIYASMEGNQSADGLVVRSIRKVNR